MFINRSFICIHDLCIFVLFASDPRNFEQLKDQKRELEVSLKPTFEISKFGNWIKLGSIKKIIYIIPKIKREDKMTSSKSEGKYWNLNLEPKYICWVLFAIYFNKNVFLILFYIESDTAGRFPNLNREGSLAIWHSLSFIYINEVF